MCLSKVWLQKRLVCMQYYMCKHLCVYMFPTVFYECASAGTVVITAIWLQHGSLSKANALLPKDQLCPAVLTVNKTLTSNQSVKCLSNRLWVTALRCVCSQNVSNNLEFLNIAYLGDYQIVLTHLNAMHS